MRLLRRKVRVVEKRKKKMGGGSGSKSSRVRPGNGGVDDAATRSTTPRAARASRLQPRIETPAVLSPSLTTPDPRPRLLSPTRSIHTANPVVAKHERVAFKAASAKPNCDICQVRPRDHRS